MKLVTTSSVFTNKVKSVLECITATAVITTGMKDNLTMNWSDAGEFIEGLMEKGLANATRSQQNPCRIPSSCRY
jgi:hypothetical protein